MIPISQKPRIAASTPQAIGSEVGNATNDSGLHVGYVNISEAGDFHAYVIPSQSPVSNRTRNDGFEVLATARLGV